MLTWNLRFIAMVYFGMLRLPVASSKEVLLPESGIPVDDYHAKSSQ
jgi:hypothetical protein